VMRVVKVLYRPALRPLGGSLVTLITFCSSPSGNLLCGSQVIQSLKSSCGFTPSPPRNPIIVCSVSSINFKPSWQFWRITHPPLSVQALITFLATSSCPSPMDTFSVGNFFFFRANSSIELVGSAPADSRKRIGT
jgi:hypothetical protein